MYTGIRQKMKMFYDAVKDYTDNKGRKLSTIFTKLPSKTVIFFSNLKLWLNSRISLFCFNIKALISY